MPPGKFALILVFVITAAGVTVGLGALALAGAPHPFPAFGAALPALLVAYVAWRVLSARRADPDNDRPNRTKV